MFELETQAPSGVSDSISAAVDMLRKKLARPAASPAEMHAIEIQAEQVAESAAEPDSETTFASDSAPEESYAYAESEAPSEEESPLPHPELSGTFSGANVVTSALRWLQSTWARTPRDLRLAAVGLPVLLAITVGASIQNVPLPKMAAQNLPQMQQMQKVVALQWKTVNQTISERAAIAFADDFRSGLDAWESRSNLTRSWSYDNAGFVRPGPLAIFKPTLELTDYRFEFLAEIDQKAMGWAFRAEDLNNYYAMKFVVVKPGPLPLIHIVRYAVINGKEGPHVEKPLPITVRPDMLYRIQITARGGDFTTMAQGQVVDFWSDTRLAHGGIGFFCNRGERARLRWVEVSHQYDALGRLCAYLAPYGMEGRPGIN